MADGASHKRKEIEPSDDERHVRARTEGQLEASSSTGPRLSSLEGLRALRALPDLLDRRSLQSLGCTSHGWFWRVKDGLLGGIVSRLGATRVARGRASELELWQIEALLPEMEASAKELCDLWCRLRNKLETQLRQQKWSQLAKECLECRSGAERSELPINLDGLDVISVDTQSFAMPAVSVIPPPPHPPPPPPNGVAPTPFQGPVTMPLLGGPAVPGTAVGTAVPATALPAAPTEHFLDPSSAAFCLCRVLRRIPPPVAGVVHQLINQVMQVGPISIGWIVDTEAKWAEGSGGWGRVEGWSVAEAGFARRWGDDGRETPLRLNIVRVIEFSLADSRVAGRLYVGFETEGHRENPGAEARSSRPDILCVEVELAGDAGKFTSLCTAHRMVQVTAGEQRSFGPWTCTDKREVEKRWLELRAKALGVLGLSFELRHFMRLMAALLGASLLPEPVSHRRLWNGLKPVVVGASPMARLRVGFGGLSTHFPEPPTSTSGSRAAERGGRSEQDRGGVPLGELLTTVLLGGPKKSYDRFGTEEQVKSRLQASANSFASSSYQYSGLADGLLTILQKNGPQGLFVGIGPVLVRAGSSDFVAAYAGEALLQRFSLPSLGFLQGLFWRTLGCGVSVLSTMPFESVAARGGALRASEAPSSPPPPARSSCTLHTPHAGWVGGGGTTRDRNPMRWRPWHVLLVKLATSSTEVLDTCDEGAPVVFLQDRLSLEPYELPSTSRSRFAGAAYPAYPVYAPQHPPRGHVALTAAGGDKLLELQLLQAEAAQKKQALEEKRAQASQSVMLASKHTTALLIGAVMVGILLVFALCMASSLGLGARGEAAYMKRRLSTSDWVVALVMGSILVMLQLYAFHHIGLLSLPTGDYAFPLMVCCVAVSFFSPVLFVSWLHCFTSFEHLDDELDHVSKRFDRLERLVSAGFHKSLQEEQELLRSLKTAALEKSAR
ncbi:Peroxisomal adenine nucleotide transporter 1 [Durusdinium trenchii]|uniref:Peroxisomal adenine nucleotide transporter 1 n=1 Tax=Durusdinium trenchii TaxID=1381693 RepID=A0ABP0IJ29_9DINO